MNDFIKLRTNNYNFILDIRKDLKLINKIKAINKKSIFLTGIPQFIKLDELKKYKYLGQYGNIVSIKKCNSKEQNKNLTYSIFVNFKKKISACLAVQSLNNFNFFKKKLKCSFSTNKICKRYLMNKKCNTNCLFNHTKINKNNSITKILNFKNKDIMDYFNKFSIKILIKNRKLLNFRLKNLNEKSDIKTIFPSLKFFLKDFILYN